MDAPVVPIRLASIAPSASKAVFMTGEPWILPATRMPPAVVKSASSNRMNGTYSRSAVCVSDVAATGAPCVSSSGISTAKPHAAEILPW